MRTLRHTALALLCSVGLTAGLVAPALADDFTTVHKGFAPPSTRLGVAAPQQMGLDPAPIAAAEAELDRLAQTAMFPGFGAVMGHDGRIVAEHHGGWANKPAQVPVKEDTIFDLASVSKLFTSIAAVQLIEEGKLSLDEPVATYLSAFGSNGKGEITVKHLLTHTSGLVAWLPLWSRHPDKASRIQAVLDATPTDPAGTVYRYSDLNLITLGLIVGDLRGKPLDQVVAERITGPLGMKDTDYNPTNRERTAATEVQTTPNRGLVWGEVHDENAWSLGGVAGHAGVFSTTHDLAILSQALLNGGIYGKQRILARESVDLLISDFTERFPGNNHGLGFELNQRWYMAGLSGPRTAGHTGFTGISLVIDFDSRSFAILLTNRVHPSRTGPGVNPARRSWAQGLALAMPVEPRRGGTAWRTGLKDQTTATLDLAVSAQRPSTLSFELFVDAEESDLFTLELSRDGGSTWEPLPYTTTDRGRRQWESVRATLPAGDLVVRFKHVTDTYYLGRGVYVDDVQVRGGVKLDTEKDPGLLVASQWEVSTH